MTESDQDQSMLVALSADYKQLQDLKYNLTVELTEVQKEIFDIENKIDLILYKLGYIKKEQLGDMDDDSTESNTEEL